MKPLPTHVHDTASPRSSCAVCFAWCLDAFKALENSPKHNVYQPRVFDKTSRVWYDPSGSTPPHQETRSPDQIPCANTGGEPTRNSFLARRPNGPSSGSGREDHTPRSRLGGEPEGDTTRG